MSDGAGGFVAHPLRPATARDGMGILVRPARPSDLEEILEIEAQAAPKSYYTAWELWSLQLRYSDTFVVAANNHLDGYVVFSPEGHVISIAVAPLRRRRGIGTLLMQYVIDYCAGKTLRLEVRVRNRPAQEFYLSLGFRKGARMRRYYEDGEDGLAMERLPTGSGTKWEEISRGRI
jgi:ribosomal-protein-alanine N-acetyltransferase